MYSSSAWKYHSVASTVLYSGCSPASGKRFGNMPSLTNCANVRKHVPRDFVPARRERQTRQRDHRVAAPIAEPRIARDHGAAVGRRAAPDDELIGRQHEPPHPIGLGSNARRREHVLLTLPLGREGERRDLSGHRREPQSDRLARAQLHLELAGHEEVLAVVEPARGLGALLEAPVPTRGDAEKRRGRPRADKAVRRRTHGSHSHAAAPPCRASSPHRGVWPW